ncbi:hypothetical protein [Mesorhizobium sp. SEMIA396]|uniref:hypothetical protein n=1 Tax=Mesorhizobium sp. SEMIA396 TaxID=2968498 RepID=UPI002117B6FA|nr:hypothetical protein [Mesorhizobium sp. SEMIA396]MCQ8814508.1 hypothetical protein [Mesorhizobium sp. SEMIA396]
MKSERACRHEAVERTDRNIVLHRMVEEQPLLLAVLWHHADAVGYCLERIRRTAGATSNADRTGCAKVGAERPPHRASLGMGYMECEDGVDDTWLAAAPLEIEVAWKRYTAIAQLTPWYDPKGERLRL